jgi:5-methylcytosine-specific restriction endonuclease McrA
MTVVRSERAEVSRNERGSAESRRRRRQWLLDTFRADIDVIVMTSGLLWRMPLGEGQPACRCFRCGALLTLETLTVDRIVPGCKGGTYRRGNIRPACIKCNRELGQQVRR